MQSVQKTPRTLNETIARIEAAWRDWLLALEAVDLDRRCEPGVCGYWSVKDLMAHISLWENEIHEHIQRWRLGLPTSDLDVDQMNAAIVAENQGRPYALVRVNMHRAHHEAMIAIQNIQGELDDDIRDRIACETWDHYPEHTDQILVWLKQEQPDTIPEPV
jgi:hypothetical protein